MQRYSIIKINDLNRRIRKGENLLLPELMEATTPLIKAVIYKYFYIDLVMRTIIFEDAIQQGYIGVLISLQRYKQSKKSKFTSYAWYYIRHYVQEYVIKSRRFPINFEQALIDPLTITQPNQTIGPDSRKIKLEGLLRDISWRDRDIFLRVYRGQTYKNIGSVYSLTKQRIEQLYNRTFTKVLILANTENPKSQQKIKTWTKRNTKTRERERKSLQKERLKNNLCIKCGREKPPINKNNKLCWKCRWKRDLKKQHKAKIKENSFERD